MHLFVIFSGWVPNAGVPQQQAIRASNFPNTNVCLEIPCVRRVKRPGRGDHQSWRCSLEPLRLGLLEQQRPIFLALSS